MSDKDSKGELKPCPFCGETPIQYLANEDDGDFVRCNNIKCTIYFDRIPIAAWNTRPITPKEEWISVKERLPKEAGEQILMFDNDNGIYGVCSAGYLSRAWNDAEPTSWMPLPSPPKDQTEKKCKNPECIKGFVTRKGVDEIYHIECPKCNWDGHIQEKRREE